MKWFDGVKSKLLGCIKWDEQEYWTGDSITELPCPFCYQKTLFIGDDDCLHCGTSFCKLEEKKKEVRIIDRGQSTIVSVLPDCDICKFEGRKATAYYDVALPRNSECWANLCEYHFRKSGVSLGAGMGQRLLLDQRRKGS